MYEDIIQIIGKDDGPTSMVLVGVHGNERCGVDALEKIVSGLTIKKGRVLIGYGNPRAIEANVRYIEVNLNRMFKDSAFLTENDKQSYEYKRAQFLKKYLNQADALLDIHASYTPESKPFVICEANASGVTEYLPVDLIVSGFDNVEPGGTDYYMNSIGKVGICVECGYLNDPDSTETAIKSFFAFLKARGHISNDVSKRKQSYIRMSDLYITKTDNFTLLKPLSDFEEVIKDQVIGIDGGIEVRAEKDGVVLFAQNQNKVDEEAFLFGEKKNSLV